MTEQEIIKPDESPEISETQENTEAKILVGPIQELESAKSDNVRYSTDREYYTSRFKQKITNHDYSGLFICIGCTLVLGLLGIGVISFVFDCICIDTIDNKLLDWISDNKTELRECSDYNKLNNNTLFLKDWVIAQIAFRCLILLVTCCGCGGSSQKSPEKHEKSGGILVGIFCIGSVISFIGCTYYSFEFYSSYKDSLNDCKYLLSDNKFEVGKDLGYNLIIVNLLALLLPIGFCCGSACFLCFVLGSKKH